MASKIEGSPTGRLLLAVAAIALGQAVQVKNGTFHPTAMLLLTCTLLLCGAAVAFFRAARPRQGDGASLLAVVAACGLALQVWQLVSTQPAPSFKLDDPRFLTFRVGVLVTAALAASGLLERPPLGRFHVPALLGAHLLLGIWFIASSRDPRIDVFVFQRDAIDWLLNGHNPYVETYPNIYGNPHRLYGPGVVQGNRIGFYPYPPLTIWLGLPGRLLGDVRYSLALAMTLSAGLLAYASPGRVSRAAAALLLLTPRGFFVLDQAWTESFVVLCLSATVFAALRSPRLLPITLGLWLASKQYVVLVAPLLPLLLGPPLTDWRRLARVGGIAVLVAAAVTLPLALWDPRAAFEDIIAFQFYQPFRGDSLSYLAWIRRSGGTAPGVWVAFTGLAVALALAAWRAPRTQAGFCAGAALAFLTFFALNKQAFCNYYHFVIGVLCCAVACYRTASVDEGNTGKPDSHVPRKRQPPGAKRGRSRGRSPG